MSENRRLKKSEELIIIHDSDFKTTRKSKVNFKANYLQISEEVDIMVKRNIKIYSRNLKSLFFIFISPLVMMILLQIIQKISNEYNQENVKIDPIPTNLSKVDLNCKNSKYFKFNEKIINNQNINDCISIGISVLVYIKFILILF
jgi:hypothetical protein